MNKKSANKKSLLDYLITVGARGGNRLFMLIVTVLIARKLGTEEFGTYSLFFGVFILLFQAFAGINIAYVREVKLKGIESEPHTLKISLLIQLAISLLVLSAGWPVSIFLSSLLDIADAGIFYLGFIAAAFIGVFGVWFGYFQAKGQFIKLGVVSTVFNAVILFFVGFSFLANINISLKDIVNSYCIVAATLAIIALICVLQKTKNTAIDNPSFISFSKMAVLNIAVTSIYFVYRYIDVYYIQYYLDLTQVGIYSAAMKTSMLLNILVGALPTILLPKAVSSIKSWTDTRRYLLKSFALSAVVILSFMIFWLFSPFFLNLLFGEEFTSGGDILRWLVIGWMLNVIYIPIAQLFYALNEVTWRLVLEVCKLAITIVLFMVLIPQVGAIGAAYALAIAILAALLLAIPLLLLLLKRSYRQFST